MRNYFVSFYASYVINRNCEMIDYVGFEMVTTLNNFMFESKSLLTDLKNIFDKSLDH